MENNKIPLNIIIIGAGAISQEWHIPILLGRSDCKVVGLVDRSEKTRTLLSKAYPNLAVFSDVFEIDTASYDAAVVATPVVFHFEITKHLLNSGKHVLVEKPIALNAFQGSELVTIAEKNKLILGVSLYRRLYPSLSVLKSLIESQRWGGVKGFSFNWGDLYSWSASSLGNMTKELAGGGVLMDLGPHALDWLCELFGHDVELLDYKDDAVSGIETDCALTLKFTQDQNDITGQLALSRIRKLGGEISVECENASLILSVGERFTVSVKPKLTASQSAGSQLIYACANENQANEEWFETFAREHDDFIGAIIAGHQHKLSGNSVLASARIIDACYAQKQHFIFDWNNTEHLQLPKLTGIKSIFITGASGFVGGRLVEVLAEQSEINIFAGINNPNKATRLSRYNINMVQFDLNDLTGIDEILQQCDVVVHCAIGTAYGDDAAIYRTTVEGTLNLLSAAERNGVSKFVHLSSLAAIDMQQSFDHINEDNCSATLDKNIYAVSKLAAEKRVIAHSKVSNMQITILRPTTIYGPHSPLFMIGAGKQAITNGLCLTEEAAKSPSNSVYIDNLILSILLRLDDKNKEFKNYFVNDDDDFTYYQFYSYFTEMFDRKLTTSANANAQGGQAHSGVFSQIISEIKQIVKSKELRKLALKVFNSKYLGSPGRWLVAKFPKLGSKLRDESGRIYFRKESVTKATPIEASTTSLVSMKKFKDDYPNYKPVERITTLKLTESWLRFCFNYPKK